MRTGSYEVCLLLDTVVHDFLIQFHWVLFLFSYCLITELWQFSLTGLTVSDEVEEVVPFRAFDILSFTSLNSSKNDFCIKHC